MTAPLGRLHIGVIATSPVSQLSSLSCRPAMLAPPTLYVEVTPLVPSAPGDPDAPGHPIARGEPTAPGAPAGPWGPSTFQDRSFSPLPHFVVALGTTLRCLILVTQA